MSDLTIKEAIEKLHILLECTDEDWNEVENLPLVDVQCKALIMATQLLSNSKDPVITTAVLLRALKIHVKSGYSVLTMTDLEKEELKKKYGLS